MMLLWTYWSMAILRNSSCIEVCKRGGAIIPIDRGNCNFAQLISNVAVAGR